ncbi:MAG: septum formation initiator family protein [Chloroflexi bacterium]|nr:septum formation initiator family protein [Chloroflexota bacterium]
MLNRVFLLLTIPILVYLGFSTGKKALDAYSLNQQANEIRRQIDALKARYTDLQNQVQYFQSEEYVEKAAREQFGLVKPGDVAVVVVAPKPVPSLKDEKAASHSPQSPPNWQLWWGFLLGTYP